MWLIDSTLRDGEQAPGVAFLPGEKIRLAQMLDETGIDEIEAGTPAMGESECEVVRRIVALRPNARISVWSRALGRDIGQAAETSAEAIHIAFPVSDIQLTAMGKEWSWVKDTLPELVTYASGLFPYVSIGAQDAGRCTPERLAEFLELAGRQPSVCRIRLADTVGMMTPLSVVALMRQVREILPEMAIDFHGHNDLGMATANAITAWQSGATALSVTVNGLGERAGNAALEEILMILSQVYRMEKYTASTLFSLCRYVADISGRPIPPGKPVCGEMAFSHESGIHAKAMLTDAAAFQAFDGKLVGRESFRTLFGKHSGRGAVRDLLKAYHLTVSDEQIPRLMGQIRQSAQKNKRSVSPLEVFVMQNNIAFQNACEKDKMIK
ncbi:MAG: homocitrate synthase [Tannerella sp.]|jgi:homocitrate synthase NifV|nr:homocitrate synthase [Tannerella sp.]